MRKSVNLFLTVNVTLAPVGKSESDASCPRESPGLLQDIGARGIALLQKWLSVQIGCPIGSQMVMLNQVPVPRVLP